MLHDSSKLIPHGLKFGQPVYFNFSAPFADYLNCWFRCYTLSLGPKHEGVQYVYLTGNLEDIHGSLILVPRDQIMTPLASRSIKLNWNRTQISAPTIRQEKLVTHDLYEEDITDFPSISEVSDQLKNCTFKHEIDDTFYSYT